MRAVTSVVIGLADVFHRIQPILHPRGGGCLV